MSFENALLGNVNPEEVFCYIYFRTLPYAIVQFLLGNILCNGDNAKNGFFAFCPSNYTARVKVDCDSYACVEKVSNG